VPWRKVMRRGEVRQNASKHTSSPPPPTPTSTPNPTHSLTCRLRILIALDAHRLHHRPVNIPQEAVHGEHPIAVLRPSQHDATAATPCMQTCEAVLERRGGMPVGQVGGIEGTPCISSLGLRYCSDGEPRTWHALMRVIRWPRCQHPSPPQAFPMPVIDPHVSTQPHPRIPMHAHLMGSYPSKVLLGQVHSKSRP
jgi:hypothetical protein